MNEGVLESENCVGVGCIIIWNGRRIDLGVEGYLCKVKHTLDKRSTATFAR